MPTIGDSTRTKPFAGPTTGGADGSGSDSGAGEAGAAASGVERTVTRIPSSDAHELADSLGARLVDGRELVGVAARTAADAEEQTLRVLAEESEQEQLLLARRDALRLFAHLAETRRDILLRFRVVRELHGALHGRVDRSRRCAEAPDHECAQLVDDREVAARREHVEQCL